MKPTEAEAPGRLRRLFLVSGIAGLAAAALGTVVTFTARVTDWGEILVNLSAYIGMASLAAAVALGAARRWRFAGLGVALTAYHALPVAALYLGGEERESGVPSERVASTVQLASSNLSFGNFDASGFLAWLGAEQPDVLGLLEVTPYWQSVLDGVDGYPHRLIEPQPLDPRPGTFSMQLLSRTPLRQAEMHRTEFASRAYLEARVELGDRWLHVVLVHPSRPGLGWGTDDRNAYLLSLARDVEWGTHSVLFGDFNATVWSPVYGDLLEQTGLTDSRLGFGWLPSWRSVEYVPGVWLDLDHIFVSGGIEVLDRSIGPDIGSDHRAAQALLGLR